MATYLLQVKTKKLSMSLLNCFSPAHTQPVRMPFTNADSKSAVESWLSAPIA